MNKKTREHVGRVARECNAALWKKRIELSALSPTEQKREQQSIIQQHMAALANLLTQELSGHAPDQGEPNETDRHPSLPSHHRPCCAH